MEPEVPALAISECEICRHLAEVETSFEKYTWEDMTRRLPPEAARLTPVGDPSTRNDEHHVRRCPLCGTFYRYDWSYDYYVNGSEDEEVLVRLTPDQARSYLTDEEYAGLIAYTQKSLKHPHPLTRSYAGKCMVAHFLARGEPTAIRTYLLHPDGDVVRGALAYVARLVFAGESLDALAGLQPVLAEAAASAQQDIAERAAWVAGQLAHYIERHDQV